MRHAAALLLLVVPALLLPAIYAGAEDRLQALMAEVERASGAAQTLSADLTITTKLDGREEKRVEGTVLLRKPNLAIVDLTRPEPEAFISDGRGVWHVRKSGAEYQRSEARPLGIALPYPAFPIEIFFYPQGMVLPGEMARYAGTEKIDGAEYRVIELTQANARFGPTRLYINSDGLVVRATASERQGEHTESLDVRLGRIRVNPPLPPESFAFRAPAGAKPAPTETGLIAAGEPAPELRLPAPGGGELRLSDVRRGRKATLLAFWFST